MKTLTRYLVGAVAISTSLVVGWVGCASSTPAPKTTTTSAEIPMATITIYGQPTAVASPPVQSMMPTSATSTLEPPVSPFDDGQIVRIASDIDSVEIAQAKTALSHASSARVRRFAEQMITAHSAVERALMATVKAERGTATDSPMANKLMSDSYAQLQTMTGLRGADFDRTYMAAQVKGHEDALELLDTRLVPNAKDRQLRAALEATRAKVVDHIALAKEIETSLAQ